MLRLMFSLCGILRIRRVASHSPQSFFMIMYLTYILIKGDGVGVLGGGAWQTAAKAFCY